MSSSGRRLLGALAVISSLLLVGAAADPGGPQPARTAAVVEQVELDTTLVPDSSQIVPVSPHRQRLAVLEARVRALAAEVAVDPEQVGEGTLADAEDALGRGRWLLELAEAELAGELPPGMDPATVVTLHTEHVAGLLGQVAEDRAGWVRGLLDEAVAEAESAVRRAPATEHRDRVEVMLGDLPGADAEPGEVARFAEELSAAAEVALAQPRPVAPTPGVSSAQSSGTSSSASTNSTASSTSSSTNSTANSTANTSSTSGGAGDPYASQVAAIASRYGCGSATILIDHPDLAGTNGAAGPWKNTMYIRSGLGARLTYVVAHECAHFLQYRAYGSTVAGWNQMTADMNAIYGGSGYSGLEQNADCITQRWGIPQHSYTSSCGGARGEAAAAIAAGRRP